MEIQELKVTIGQVYEGYFNDAEEGVVGYDERLDIRPKYQREFVYKDKQRDEVIRTVMKGLPLNVIYWCKVKKEDGSDGFEVLDGQQRTISVCEYVDGTFSVDEPAPDRSDPGPAPSGPRPHSDAPSYMYPRAVPGTRPDSSGSPKPPR